MIHLKDVPGEVGYRWVWEHPPFFVRVYLTFQTHCWWAEVGKTGEVPKVVSSYKSLEELMTMVEEHLLEQYPETREIIHPPSALVRVGKTDWVV